LRLHPQPSKGWMYTVFNDFLIIILLQMNVEGCASRLTRSLLHHYNVARKSTTFGDRKVIA
jgi:hypothetical protein